MPTKKEITRKRRHDRIRSKIKGTAKRPRLVVSRSLSHVYAQLVDDEKRKVLASTSDLKDKSKGTKTEKANKVGLEIAKKASEKKITKAVFDRGGHKYHGRIKAVAEGANKGGLKF